MNFKILAQRLNVSEEELNEAIHQAEIASRRHALRAIPDGARQYVPLTDGFMFFEEHRSTGWKPNQGHPLSGMNILWDNRQ